MNTRRSCLIAAIAVLSATPLLAAQGQRIAPAAAMPAATRSSRLHVRADSSISLTRDMKRGAVIGSLTGGALGLIAVGAYVWSNTRETCCEQPQPQVRFTQIVTIESVATAGGAILGAILGYSYHFNRSDRSASRATQPNER